MQTLLGDDTLALNETAHVHHCRTGRNNDRCYITNKGTVTLFYCHHCGKKGVLKKSLARVKARISPPKTLYPRGTGLPSDCLYSPSSWPIDARLWINRAGVSSQMALDNNIGYSPRFNRVVIPINYGGVYQGYSARRIGKEGPKYLARCKSKDKFLFVKHVVPNQSVILVEDILSCIRISELGYNCVALQGVHLSDSMLNYLSSNYNMFSIYLDNDKIEVKIQQIRLKNELELYGSVKLIKTTNDPKEYSNDELEEILK